MSAPPSDLLEDALQTPEMTPDLLRDMIRRLQSEAASAVVNGDESSGHEDGGEEHAQDVVEYINKAAASGSALDLSGYQLSDEQTDRILQLAALFRFEKVQASSTALSHRAFAAILTALGSSGALRHLFIGHNGIGVRGSRALAECLIRIETLRVLDLDRVGLGSRGAILLAVGLKRNRSLQGLGLYDNAIGDVGAEALAASFKVNCTLMRINLASNGIGLRGQAALASALSLNRTLIAVDGVGPSLTLPLRQNIAAHLLHSHVTSTVPVGAHVWAKDPRGVWVPAQVTEHAEGKFKVVWWVYSQNTAWIAYEPPTAIYLAQPSRAPSAAESSPSAHIHVDSVVVDASCLTRDRKIGSGAFADVSLVRSTIMLHLLCAGDGPSPSALMMPTHEYLKQAHDAFKVVASTIGCEQHKRVYYYALKQFRSDSHATDPENDALVRSYWSQEITVSSRLAYHTNPHPHVLRIFGIIPDSTVGFFPKSLLVEYCPGGTLEQYILSRQAFPHHQQFSPVQLLSIARQLLSGLHHLHSAGNIIHRDLAPRNILMSADAQGQVVLKIADFTTSKHLPDQSVTYTGYASATAHVSPSIRAQETELVGYTKQSDIYSIGVVLLECASMQLFTVETPTALLKLIDSKLQDQYGDLVGFIRSMIVDGGAQSAGNRYSQLSNIILPRVPSDSVCCNPDVFADPV